MQVKELKNQSSSSSKHHYWRSIIDEWLKSGLKKKAFCEKAGINYHTFTYWQGKTLSKANVQPVIFAKAEIKRNLAPRPEESTQPISIELPSKLKIIIPNFFDGETVSRLLKLLGVTHA